MDYPQINGIAYGWAEVVLNVAGIPIRGVKGINYSESVERGKVRGTRASLTVRVQAVYSRATLLLKSPASKPASISVEISGLRSGLPSCDGMRPEPTAVTCGAKVVNWSKAGELFAAATK